MRQSSPGLRGVAVSVLGGLDTVLGFLAAGLLAALLMVVLAGVVLRYAFSTGFIGAEDLGIWLHVAMIAVGAPLSLKSALAMRLDVFVRLLPSRPRRAAEIFADAFSFVAAFILLFGGVEIAAMLGGVSPTLGLPEWVRFSFLGIGGGLILVYLFLQRLVEGRGVAALLSLLLATGT